MAHTDKTDPFWVNIATGYYKSEEIHDHRFTECDLPPLRDRTRTEGWHGQTTCYWNFVWDGRQVCACYMCHSMYFETYNVKYRELHRTISRRTAKQWRDEYNTYGEIEEWWA